MIEMAGRFADCKIFNDEIDEASASQVMQFLNHPAFERCKVRFMPDIHAGAGAVIGTTVELNDKVIPNVIGVDIGCGMLSVKLKEDIETDNFAILDEVIRKFIPSGFNVNEKPHTTIPAILKYNIKLVCKFIGDHPERHLKSIGSLGGGNHFIELGQDETGAHWLTIHSGSRNFGHKIATYWQRVAKALKLGEVPTGMEYLEGNNKDLYIEQMRIAQSFASINRTTMMTEILAHMNWTVSDRIETIHNYISDDRIIRKGAVSAKKGERLIIPWNMRDGLIIGEGKGNPDWNYSAPHGAGRIMSRSKAKETLTLEDFERAMTDVYSTCVKQSTLDEAPMAYKDSEAIEKYIEPTVKILHRVKPLYNFKA